MGDVESEIQTRRRIDGMSAILLPFDANGSPDWDRFAAHTQRTLDAGLVPAVNMDTGYVQTIDPQARTNALEIAAKICAGQTFVAGAYVADTEGAPLDVDAYKSAIASATDVGATPIVFPSWGLNSLGDVELIEALETVTTDTDRFLGFELGKSFVPYGRIYSDDMYIALMALNNCVGAKHSSLSRSTEWGRLALRDEHRNDFDVLTGNDRAIDMVRWGSNYLLGLSTMAPDYFAQRDALWESGDSDFYALNDLLQYLGEFTFRDPVPAYRHSAAQFLMLRGWIETDQTPHGTPRRPDADRAVLAEILTRLRAF
jgi:dihydrodipicolinate synthase/N-acetylneuraminate lyase